MSTPDANIRSIEWVPASVVHPHEAHNFTPWLTRNLVLLADVLGLDELQLRGTEVAVGDYRLDILASGQLGEEEWPVAIEIQYGTTDHRHLGQLITYLAQQEQGHAVWIVEDASDQHVAAIEFLNRTTVADYNYWLLRARFAPDGDGFQVYFDIVSRPNDFIRLSYSSHGGNRGVGRRADDERFGFHSQLLELLRPAVTAAGWRNLQMPKSGYYLRMLYPASEPLSRWGVVQIRSHSDHFYVHLIVDKGDKQANRAIVDALREEVGEHLEASVPSGAEVRWHEAGQSADGIKVIFQEDGYSTAPDAAATSIATVCTTWLEILSAHPSDRGSELARHLESN